ncbi:uncharacterized protein LOC106943577 [Poecilia latipinna]|uniref:uncharacterized protein LOC106943577 n=1 Tax=Poecilia latipinna TaxID=48699 RepID=UPI00072EB4B3|nr:PREDICTED: uncharacterized protein LOC106943577 [Poecilia latipinna]
MKIGPFLKSSTWISGPEFLTKHEIQWPTVIKERPVHLEPDPEVKDQILTCVALLEKVCPTTKLLMYFSSWTKLKRSVAWILKLKERMQTKKLLTRHRGNKMYNDQDNKMDVQLTTDDLLKAEEAIVSFVQRKHFGDEIAALSSGAVKKSSHLYKLDPVVTDGVLRVGGRLSKAALPEETKHPVILPKESHVSKLILQHIHEKVGHRGRNHMLSTLRRQYWIPHANSAARKIIRDCMVCQRQRRKPVHLEVAHSLDTDSCINAIRRFICRRGQVKEIRSDNGTNFVSSNRELKQAVLELKQSKIQKCLAQDGIKWTFNPPYGAHHGGVWERLVQEIKRVLCSITNQQVLDDEGLHTVFCEVEAILNDRPITPSSEDPNDLEVLTPNHLLQLKSKPVLPPCLSQKEVQYIRRRWRQAQYIVDLFWKRWVKEYLPLLQERRKWNKTRRNFAIDDVVLVVDEAAPRNSWPIGYITETMGDASGLG